MKINEVVRRPMVVELTVDPLETSGNLNSRQFSQLISNLKTQELDSKDAVQASRMVRNMWSAGDKLLRDYKKLLQGFNINIKQVLDQD